MLHTRIHIRIQTVTAGLGGTGLGFLHQESSLRIPLEVSYRKCTSEGIGRQGIVLEHRTSLLKEPMPCRPMPLPA